MKFEDVIKIIDIIGDDVRYSKVSAYACWIVGVSLTFCGCLLNRRSNALSIEEKEEESK